MRKLDSKETNQENKGQITIMLGMMMLTFLFFFCFVVNVGMLVNAKISLQNAADLAAYAGAAVQARQLNTISYLNYEMRRQYKKFLFRYYVIGTMAQDSAPKTSAPKAGSTPRKWEFQTTNCPPSGCTDYKLPIVCIIYNSADNFCHLPLSPGIVAPQPSSFDAINESLVSALVNIESKRQQNCQLIGTSNEMVLLLWLWNTDPTVQTLGAQLAKTVTAEGVDNVVPVISGLTQGLGLVPRELILRQRIKTMEGYVNNKNQTNMNEQLALSLRSAKDPSRYERSIQAYFSAYLSLGNHTFSDPTSITMDELMPPGGPDGSLNLLNLNDISTTFDAWSEELTPTDPKDPSVTSINAKDCVPQATLQQIKTGLVVGVVKDPTVLTYYAIRLRAQAKVLFNPFGGTIQLTAYSAARPFGSRIGPRLTGANFIWTGILPNINKLTGSGLPVPIEPLNQIPNLAILPGEGTGSGNGWDTVEAQGTFFSTAFPALAATTNPGSTPPISSADLDQAYQVAMAPNLEEEGYYNIPTEGDSNFASTFNGQSNLVLWAPMAPPDEPGAFSSDMASTLKDMLQGIDATSQQFATAAITQLGTYVNTQLAGGAPGDDGETMNTVTLHNPFNSVFVAAPPTLTSQIQLPEWVMPDPTKDMNAILTSWNTPNDATYRAQGQTYGRAGYSVKFVPLSALTGSGGVKTSDAGDTLTNTIPNDDTSADLGQEMSH